MVQRVLRLRAAACFGLVLLWSGGPARAHPVVVELFTSQACAACPPAEALLARLAKSPDILPLSFDVTYLDSPAWRDSFGLQAATARQAWYAGLHGSQIVYTPQAVVDGSFAVPGSSPGALSRAIAAAKAAPAGDVLITLARIGPAMLSITIGPGPGNAEIWLFGYDAKRSIRVTGGVNAGKMLAEVNVVRSINNLGRWMGLETSMAITRPKGQHIAVLLQTASGAVIGAAAE